MPIPIVERALQRLQYKFTYRSVHDSPKGEGQDAIYELSSTRYKGYSGYLKAEVLGDPDKQEMYLTWSVAVAVLEDLAAAPLLLLQNSGGLKDKLLLLRSHKARE